MTHDDAAPQVDMTRMTWDEYFLTIAKIAAKRSTCSRAQVGAVIVRGRSILATGYNGAPAGMPHCTDVGCLVYESITPTGDSEHNCWRTIHAEINAIAQAAANGVAIADSTAYVTHSPCIHCLKVLTNTGITRVVYERPYKLETLEDLRRGTNVRLEQLSVADWGPLPGRAPDAAVPAKPQPVSHRAHASRRRR